VQGSTKKEIVRFTLLVIGGFLGCGLAVLFVSHNWTTVSEEMRRDSFKFQSLIFQAVVLFFMTTYNVGYYGMKLFKIEDQAEEILREKRRRTLYFNIAFLFLFVMGSIYK
jgi:predicted Na+-dependent transporter